MSCPSHRRATTTPRSKRHTPPPPRPSMRMLEPILKLTKRYWQSYTFAPFHEEEYNGRTHLSWSDVDSSLQVATAKNVGAGRSRTLRAVHGSEVAFRQNGEELMGGLARSIPAIGATAVFIESTANGVGNYYHAQWVAAK